MANRDKPEPPAMPSSEPTAKPKASKQSKARRWLKELGGALALILLLTGLVDVLRAPNAEALDTLTLTGIEGQVLDLKALSQDEPLLVYAWASWCSVCRFTGDTVQRLHSEGVPVLGIALTSGDDAALSRYLKGRGYDFANVNDDAGDYSRALGISVTPTFLVISQGKVVAFTTGWTSWPGLKLRLWLAPWLY